MTEEQHYGPSWAMIRDILASPKPLQNPSLRMACLLLEYPKLRASITALSGKLKIDVFKIEECATYNPRLFSIEHGAKFIRLLASGENPTAETPAEEEKRKKEELEKIREVSKAMAEQAEYDQDTPFNTLWKKIEKLGLDRKAAKGLAKRLTSSYPENIIEEGLKAAERAQPINVSGYIIGTIQKILSAGTASGAAQPKKRHQKVFARTKRIERKTVLIGWEFTLRDGIRHKLFRLPEGTIQRVPPKPGEHVPSFEDDPGYEVT